MLDIVTYMPTVIVKPTSVWPNRQLLQVTLRIDFRFCQTVNAVCRFKQAEQLVDWINTESPVGVFEQFDLIIYETTILSPLTLLKNIRVCLIF